VGFASVAVSSILMIYYSVIIAWGLRFLIASLTDHLPWIDCKNCECLFYNKNTTGMDMQGYLTNNTEGLNCSK
jgi:SNF family Na+-dependent transporter